MTTSRRFILLAVAIAISTAIGTNLFAAPVESVESSRAAAAIEKIDAFLGEAAVAKQMAALGLTRDEVQARLCKLSDTQLENLAAQVDTIKAGGTIQRGVSECNPVVSFCRQVSIFFHNIYSFFFCWEKH